MYSRKVPQTILNSKHNLQSVTFENKIISVKCCYSRYVHIIRKLREETIWKTNFNVSDKMQALIKNMVILNLLRNSLATVPRSLRSQSSSLLKVWAHQCECVVAQRLRRGQQMFCLYSKLWEEHALKEFLKKMRQQMTRKSKELVFGAVGIATYNWRENRITDAEIRAHMNELDYIYLLKQETLICKNCNHKKLVTDKSHLTSCTCTKGEKTTYQNWDLFLEKEDVFVWRKMQDSGHYEYKVYGSYDDVTAADFLNVQIDTDYRRSWDNTAIVLEVIDTDPDLSSNTDVVYWEMLWPRLFSNRDYVFSRRFVVDEKKKTLVIKNRGTEHPARPVKSDKYRVQDYWSYMVIKPYTEIDKPGIEFALAYYDNPGISIPSAVTSWVAMRAMPEFLARLREAAKNYKEYCETHQCKTYKARNEEFRKTLSEDVFIKNTLESESFAEKDTKGESEMPKEPSDEQPIILGKTSNPAPGTEIITSPSPVIQAEKDSNGYWKYLHPTYYLG